MGDKNYYYYHFDDGLDVLLSRLVEPRSREKHYNEYDIMVHVIYHFVATTSLYKKKDIQETIWKRVEPLYQKKVEDIKDEPSATSIETYKKRFNRLFSECWVEKFVVKPNSRAKRLSRMAYRNRPFYMKLYNSDWALLVFTILFLMLINYIDTSFTELDYLRNSENPNKLDPAWGWAFAFLPWTLAFSLFFGTEKGMWFAHLIPFCFMIILAIIEVFFNTHGEFITIALVKRDILIGCAYLLWIPIAYLNAERISDSG